MSDCGACKRVICGTDKLSCSLCSGCFHYKCVGLSKENFGKLSVKSKTAWKCPECKIPVRKCENTPVKSPESDCPSPLDRIDQRLREFEEKFLLKIDALFETRSVHFRELQSEFDSLHNDIKLIPELIESVRFMSVRYEELIKDVSDLRSETKELRTENAALTSGLKELNLKINMLEQQSRECNVELQCLPEYTEENLSKTVMQLSKVVSCALDEKEVISCSRVSKLNKNSTRSRAVIIKLSSVRARDSLLASCMKFNKSNPTEKLNTSHLGLAGDRQDIFVSEHLSPGNRALHAQARAFKREKNYKYIWVRNGRVMLRKSDSDPAIWVTSSDVLKKLDV